jgi:hypothetical protein
MMFYELAVGDRFVTVGPASTGKVWIKLDDKMAKREDEKFALPLSQYLRVEKVDDGKGALCQ